MKKIIYKYSIDSSGSDDITNTTIGGVFSIEMVFGSDILAVQAQKHVNEYGIIQATGKIWALSTEGETRREKRFFRLMETGTPFDDENLIYIGTYQLYDGDIVLHLYEQK